MKGVSPHTIATIETDNHGQARYVCSCGVRGLFVRSVIAARLEGGPKHPPVVLEAEDWARGAHRWHALRAAGSQ